LISGRKTPFSRDYISVLWRKFKQIHPNLQEGVTLYSFRHTGAIKVFEKTGSLQKLQQVMGHSDMKVSLTYLRGLEVKQLDVEDLPEL
jgi:integrase